MGLVEVALALLKPLTDATGVDPSWITAAALNIVIYVGAIKRWLAKWFVIEGWGVWSLGAVVSAVYALQLVGQGWAAVAVAALGSFIVSVGNLGFSGRVGHLAAGNKFGANPSRNKG